MPRAARSPGRGTRARSGDPSPRPDVPRYGPSRRLVQVELEPRAVVHVVRHAPAARHLAHDEEAVAALAVRGGRPHGEALAGVAHLDPQATRREREMEHDALALVGAAVADGVAHELGRE